MARLRVEELVKTWGDVRAVDNVSFETADAEFVALLGPSGCGKSTTLRLIAGLESASAGRILIDAQDVTHLPPARRKVSMVFQSYALFPHLTAADNITFGLSVRGVPKAERKARLERTASLLGISELLHRKPSQLSGGQQQRVALGRALISEAPACLLDEPLSNLDAKLRAEMRNEIRSLQKRLGITMIFVTHDQTEAMSMSDRVILMNKGRVEQSGAPADLYEKPLTTFVAGFVGTPPMNLLPAVSRDGRLSIAEACESPEGLLLGVRPEQVMFVERGQKATVESSEYFGADTVVHCRVGEQRVMVRVSGRLQARPGAEVHLGWPEDAVHVFDAVTGVRRN